MKTLEAQEEEKLVGFIIAYTPQSSLSNHDYKNKA